MFTLFFILMSFILAVGVAVFWIINLQYYRNRAVTDHINRCVIQGGQHRKIQELYDTIAKAVKREYTEDNNPTLLSFLRECHETSLRNVFK